jgi:hypothetical protein
MSKCVVFLIQNFKGCIEKHQGLCSWHRKDYKVIYILWRWRIVERDESNSDSEFTVIIGFGGKSTSYWKIDKRQFWKWKGVWRAYKTPISKFDVGKTSCVNRRKACKAQVVSTTRSGMARRMDWRSLEKAQF